MSKNYSTPVSFLYHSTQSSWLWLVLRLYIGWGWLSAGYEKAINSAWIGNHAGTAITGFFNGALVKATGDHPDVSAGYAYFLQHVAIPHAVFFSYLIPAAEISIGLALIFGLFTGVAAFFGATMNFNFMFAGSVSVNPYWIIIETFLVLAWRVSGYIGLDRYFLPSLRKLSRH
jgi:thiosulfate dehydrogenase [quinone] large subunit